MMRGTPQRDNRYKANGIAGEPIASARSAPSPLTPAAQYLRMSTENQAYSIVNQAKAIEEYAAMHGYGVIVSYADPGKSGLLLKNRPGLQQLLSDAIDPQRAFDAVLVLDVSRWGRFQDPDQAAHYEFICRQAGLRIVYCAEPFEGDDSSMATLVKDLKRVMASEYSRELSAKNFRAKMRLARLGFKQGGTDLPYGFQRLLVDENRKPRFILKPGERKNLKTDRIVIIAGTRQEQKIIRRIFRLFVDHRLSTSRIARRLNADAIPGWRGRSWTHSMVTTVLKSELCIGCYVYNQTRTILRGPVIHNPEDEWVRVQIMKPIIPEEMFRKAQDGLKTHRWTTFSAEKTLAGLRDLLHKKGRISNSLIAKSKDLPCPSTIVDHFGSLDAALAQIGYARPAKVIRHCGAALPGDEEIFAGLRRLHQQHGYITRRMINHDRALPGADYIQRRFGTVYRAYELAGLPPVTHRQVTRAARQRRKLRDDAAVRGGRKPKTVYSSNEIIAGLKRILKKHGRLSGQLIDSDPRMPCASTVYVRFGSRRKAYKLAGWSKTHRQITQASLDQWYKTSHASP